MSEATKHDKGKPRMELLPPEFLIEVAEVFTFGADRYGTDNWYHGTKWRRYHGAALRHIAAWAYGEDKDPDSGLSHLAHAGACLAILSCYAARDIGTDDRLKMPSTPLPLNTTTRTGEVTNTLEDEIAAVFDEDAAKEKAKNKQKKKSADIHVLDPTKKGDK